VICLLFKNIPLFYVNINRKKFKEFKEGSCIAKIHPCINQLNKEKQDKVRELINEAIDIIRDNIEFKDL
jgi:hypothetical protein